MTTIDPTTAAEVERLTGEVESLRSCTHESLSGTVSGRWACDHCGSDQGAQDEQMIQSRLIDAQHARDAALAENEQLRDDLRVERITTHLCESVDADLRETRAEVERLTAERDEARAEVKRLEADLDGAAYRAGRKQGELAKVAVIVDRVRKLAEHWRAADSWHGNAYADDVLRALDKEAGK